MRWNFMAFLSLVQLNNLLRVDRQSLVRVHDNAEKTRVRLQTLPFNTESCIQRSVNYRLE